MDEQKKSPGKKRAAVGKGVAAVFGPVAGMTTVEEEPAAEKKTRPKKAADEKKPAAKGKTAKGKSGSAVKGASGTKKKVPGAAAEGKTKVTYYVSADLVKKLKAVGEKIRRKDSSLAEEAIEDLVKKYAKRK